MIEIKWFNDIENAKLGKHPDNITAKIDEILNNRTQNVMISYDFAMFYFEKGINDRLFPKNTEQINYENLYSFKYFIENFL